MPMRTEIRRNLYADERAHLRSLIKLAKLSTRERIAIQLRAINLVTRIRTQGHPGIMEVFLEEYGLSTDEGIALMCLAEALLRVPDAPTIDALIDDKIAPSNWGKHLGKSSSSLVNASTWALLLTGKILDEGRGVSGVLRGMLKRVGEPVIRRAVARAMREMGKQFVLGRNISEALRNGRKQVDHGYTYSYDMLGEAAMTDQDARRYHLAYSGAISTISQHCSSTDIRENPGISVKLSALFPRYEHSQREQVMANLVPRALSLAQLAKSGGMGFNIDAEEAARLDLSLDVIQAVLSDPSLAGWDGFGVVVQAYAPRAPYVIDWLNKLATQLDRRIMVRLVKGAYWDTEIKLAQVEGLAGFPVFTRKPSTDVSYIACARKLLGMTNSIYPQFATHNAHTIAAILEMAPDPTAFEFQRLHGMGESVHDIVLSQENTRCRIYAPVGAHRDLLAYLVRRLLENGANSSFVNQIVDVDIPAETVVTDPFIAVQSYLKAPENPNISHPSKLFAGRQNSTGWNLNDPDCVTKLLAKRAEFDNHLWQAGPLIAGPVNAAKPAPVFNPAVSKQQVGTVSDATDHDVEIAIGAATPWAVDAQTRRDVLFRAADLYETHSAELFSLACREAGKTLPDAVSELREAVDFLRYYADAALNLSSPARGIITCISPWNFPLAIFTGQLGAALAAGNGVLAKPAEATPLIAFRAIQLLHQAGVPREALQFLPGQGSTVGAALTSDPRINGVVFTGSTPTAHHINQSMAETMSPHAPLIAETGGINAMIVDSSALLEQAIRDIVASAFQSAGQRCSALRVLFVQEDIAIPLQEMLFGAINELVIGDPWHLKTDLGPVIDAVAKAKIQVYIETARSQGRLLKHCPCPQAGTFVGPAVIKVDGMQDLQDEVFGPVLHIATFKASDLDKVIEGINDSGYGLTFGLHTRIDDRVQHVVDRLKVGNIYVNRNQIGAVVGSQPFGGEGLSGTGPKAGGPHYLRHFTDNISHTQNHDMPRALPGPTGESNRLSISPRGTVLCLGPSVNDRDMQHKIAAQYGCKAVDGPLDKATDFDAVVFWGADEAAIEIRKTLAKMPGVIIPLITTKGDHPGYILERHICVDTTASGGNTALLSAAADP